MCVSDDTSWVSLISLTLGSSSGNIMDGDDGKRFPFSGLMPFHTNQHTTSFLFLSHHFLCAAAATSQQHFLWTESIPTIASPVCQSVIFDTTVFSCIPSLSLRPFFSRYPWLFLLLGPRSPATNISHRQARRGISVAERGWDGGRGEGMIGRKSNPVIPGLLFLPL